MVREYTQDILDKLKDQLDDIKDKDWCGFTDFLGDCFLKAGKWIGHLSLDDDKSNLDTYHKKILDMNNTTKTELDEIFERVYSEDSNFSTKFNELESWTNTYILKIQTLTDLIKPGFKIANSVEIANAMQSFNSTMENQGSKINEIYLEEVNYAIKQNAIEASKGLIKGIVNTGLDILLLPVSLTKDLATGDFIGIANDTIGLIDGTFAIGSNLSGLSGSLLALCFSSPEKKDFALRQLDYYTGNKGLSDVLDDEFGEDSIISKVWKYTDSSVETLSIFGDIKDFVKDPKSLINPKFGFKDKVKPLEWDKSSYLKKDKFDDLNNLYQKLAKDSHYVTVSNIKKGFKYLSSGLEIFGDEGGVDEAGDEFLKTATEEALPFVSTIDDVTSWIKDLFAI